MTPAGPSDRQTVLAGGGPAAPDGASQFVTFVIGGEEYALRITQVREIIGHARATRLPQAAPHVIGLTNLRGDVLPVFDLRRWFGLAEAALPPASTIIAEWQGDVFGFTVDSVHQVIWLSPEQVDPPTSHFQQRSPYIEGLGKYQGRMVIILDLAALFADVREDGSPAR